MKDKKSSEIPLAILLIILILIVCALINTFRTRTSHDIIKYSSYISGAAAVFFIGLIIYFSFQPDTAKARRSDLVIYFAVLIATLIIGPVYYSIGVSLKDLYFWTKSPSLSKQEAIILALIITLILGLTLFYFRLRARSIYGLTEAAVGLIVAANKVSLENSHSIATSNFYLAILTASVYLVVRGLDNIHQGLTKDPVDSYALFILSKFKRTNSQN